MKTSSTPESSFSVDALEPRTLLSYAYQSLSDIVPQAAPTVLAEGFRGPVAIVDDVNGDGVNDVLVGSMGEASGATILSGVNGTALRTHTRAEARFGWSLAALSDVNADGTDDYVIGTGAGTGASAAFVYSGATGDLLYTLGGSATPGGATVARAGDVNGDGRDDILVGFMGENRVGVFSGIDGSLFREHFGDAGDNIALLGVGLGGGADVNGDGVADYVYAGHRGTHAGSGPDPFDVAVYVVSGANGALLRAINTPTEQPQGAPVVPTISFDVSADFNDDGVNEIVFPTGDGWRILDPTSGLAVLSLHILANGTVQNAIVVGDQDRDGTPDVAVGFPTAPNANVDGQVGQVTIYSGASGSRLGILTDGRSASADARIGTAIAYGSDLNGDGVADLIAVGDQNPAAGAVGAGRVYLFTGTSLLPLIPDGVGADPNGNVVTWGSVSGRQFLIRHNKLVAATELTGFTATDQIVDYATAADGTELLLGQSASGTPFIWRSGSNFTNGTRTDITGFAVVGDPGGTYSSLVGVGINGSGDVTLVRNRDGFGATGWLFDSQANTLTYLFDGTPHVINEAGNVIGLTPESTSTHYWTPGGLTTIDGMVAVLMNDESVLVGRAQRDGDAAPRLYTWQNGTFTPVPLIDGGQDFTAQGINNEGVIVGVYRVAVTFTVSMFVYDPVTNTTTDLKQEVDVDAPAGFNNAVTFAVAGINNSGAVLARDPLTSASFVLVPYEDSGPFTVDDTAVISSAALPDGGLFVATRNPAGEVIAFVRSPINGPWRKLDIAMLAGVPRITGDVVTWHDPQENLTYIAAASNDGLLLITQLSNGSWQVRNLTTEIGGAEAIVKSPVALQPQSGMTIIGGLTASGDLVIYGQTTQTNGQNQIVWAYDNLFNSVIRAQGLEVPVFDTDGRGKLISYETSWDGLNIVGATTEGRPVAIWTAPGVQGWHVTDLADAAPNPEQVGDFKNLTVYITSWGGINLATGDDLKVLWWVPQFEGDWAISSLRDVAGGPALRGETLSAYFAPWGGLNVAGLDEEGRLFIYWWTPQTDQWFVTQIDPESPDSPVPFGNVSSLATPNSLSVFARAQSGDLIHYLWQPDMWTVTDVTLVAGA